jgi:tetratricopeptide (TPR) repeat protein
MATLPEGRTAEHCFVRALVSVGQGHCEEALRDCESQSSTDLTLLRALVHLHAHNVNEARDDALAAASQSPTSPDVLLIRAQVELESAENLEEGRDLLERVFATMQQDLRMSRWPMLQGPFAEGRATFHYFLAELADVSKTPDTLDFAEAVDRSSISDSQEARLDYIRGKFLRARGQSDQASEAFENAAKHFDTAQLIPAAVNSARLAFDLGQRAWPAARLAKLLWDQSYSDFPDDERLRLVEEAAQILSARDLRDEDAGASDVLIYYAGFLDLRKTELIGRDRQLRAWTAVSALMAAVLNSNRNPYRTRFLADAFDLVGALGPATIVADCAFSWNNDDEMREAAVVARSHYYRGSASVEALLGGFTDRERYGEWCEAVRFSLQVDSGEHDQLAKTRPRSVYDAPWARFLEAKAVALFENVTKARPLFEKVAEELSDKAGNEYGAAEAWLHAGRPTTALEILDKGDQLQNIDPRPAAWLRALAGIGLGAGDQTSAKQAIDGLAPIQLSEALYATLPILRTVYPTEAFRTEIGPLGEHLQRVLARREREPISKGGLEDAPDTMRPLVLAMWSLIESREAGADPRDAVERLKALKPGGRLGRVIEHACDDPPASENA